MTSSWPPTTALFKHFSKFLQISAFYSTIKWKLPQKQWLKLLIILRKLFWNKFFQKFFSFLALWRHLDPKTALFGHFEQLFPNCGLLRNNKWSLPHKTTILFVHDTQVNIWKKKFPHFYTILALWRHLDPKNCTFDHFEQVLADFSLLLSYNMEITSKTMVEIDSNTQETIFKKDFPKIFTILTAWRHLDPKNGTFQGF